MFYVYEWYNTETGFIFYVGKGCNGRYKSMSHRNKLFLEYQQNNPCDTRIVKQFDDEESAFEYERERIKELKASGQATCNLDHGGTGGPQFVWTEEMRAYKSVFNPMKDEKQKKRMSESNPVYDRAIGEKIWAARRRPVVIGHATYKSVREAASFYGVRESTIMKWCRKGINPKKEPCRYKDSKQKEFKGKRYNKGGCRPLIYKGVEYESPIDLALELGLHHSTVAKWAKRGFDPQGNVCKYLDDSTEHIFVKKENGEACRKPIYVNGTLYKSKRDAEITLGLCKGYLSPYIAGTRKNKNYICEYADQKPSRTKSGNSSPEGSTTNE